MIKHECRAGSMLDIEWRRPRRLRFSYVQECTAVTKEMVERRPSSRKRRDENVRFRGGTAESPLPLTIGRTSSPADTVTIFQMSVLSERCGCIAYQKHLSFFLLVDHYAFEYPAWWVLSIIELASDPSHVRGKLIYQNGRRITSAESTTYQDIQKWNCWFDNDDIGSNEEPSADWEKQIITNLNTSDLSIMIRSVLHLNQNYSLSPLLKKRFWYADNDSKMRCGTIFETFDKDPQPILMFNNVIYNFPGKVTCYYFNAITTTFSALAVHSSIERAVHRAFSTDNPRAVGRSPWQVQMEAFT